MTTPKLTPEQIADRLIAAAEQYDWDASQAYASPLHNMADGVYYWAKRRDDSQAAESDDPLVMALYERGYYLTVCPRHAMPSDDNAIEYTLPA